MGLVLSRLVGESIMVGDAKITVFRVQGNKIRLFVEASKEVPIHRLEIYEAIKRGEADTT